VLLSRFPEKEATCTTGNGRFPPCGSDVAMHRTASSIKSRGTSLGAGINSRQGGG